MIIPTIQKQGQKLNLSSLSVDIEDTTYLSHYFTLSEFESKFSSGKNTFLLNGSSKMAQNSRVQIEVLDSENNSLYIEIAKSNRVGFTQGGALRVAVYVYNNTPFGVGKIIMVGKTIDNKMVRWMANIQIDPLTRNTSAVVFYKFPKLEITPQIVPVGNVNNENFIGVHYLTGSIKTTGVTPRRGYDYDLFNTVFQELDYRAELQDSTNFTSASMTRSDITFFITEYNGDGVAQQVTTSNVIGDIINDKTFRLKSPIYTTNRLNAKSIVDVTSATFSASVSSIQYSSSWSAVSLHSLALVEYTNIDTFCGNVYRHKLYRRSLSSAGDYELISDSPIIAIEALKDEITPNSYFSSLGTFPVETQLKHYWHTSSTDITLTRDGSFMMDAMKISGALTEKYIIVKNDTIMTEPIPRCEYVPYNKNSIDIQSGSAYDSNFMYFFPNVPYELTFNSSITKIDTTQEASVGFYITSSMLENIQGDFNFDGSKGVKLGEIVLGSNVTTRHDVDKPNQVFSTFANEFYGTMVIYSKNCVATLSNISIKTYSEFSFSPLAYYAYIPFPVTVRGQQFQFKAELFDVNHNLVYSDLHAIATFDPSGSTIATATIAPPSAPTSMYESTTTNISKIVSGVTVTVPTAVTVNTATETFLVPPPSDPSWGTTYASGFSIITTKPTGTGELNSGTITGTATCEPAINPVTSIGWINDQLPLKGITPGSGHRWLNITGYGVPGYRRISIM